MIQHKTLFDLEMWCWQENYIDSPNYFESIEIGLPRTEIPYFGWYAHPFLYPRITTSCEEDKD